MDNNNTMNGGTEAQRTVTLCASCDRCRVRKTKCDGNRPCGNCVNKFMRKNRIDSIDGVDYAAFECVYSPAKRRGPAPGASSNRKRDQHQVSAMNTYNTTTTTAAAAAPTADFYHQQQQHQQSSGISTLPTANHNSYNPTAAASASIGGYNNNMFASSLSADARLPSANIYAQSNPVASIFPASNFQDSVLSQYFNTSSAAGLLSSVNQNGAAVTAKGLYGNTPHHQLSAQALLLEQDRLLAAQRRHAFESQHHFPPPPHTQIAAVPAIPEPQVNGSISSNSSAAMADIDRSAKRRPNAEIKPESEVLARGPMSISKHLHLLNLNSLDGNLLRSLFNLSVGELFSLPPVPTDEEYCKRFQFRITPSILPKFDLSALRAARFAELALGALVNHQVELALELSNATVLNLSECVDEPVHPSCLFDVARGYFLHGIFRSFRGDMVRYFKHRRVCLLYLSKLDDLPETNSLLAAISIHDAWAYMIHNASEDSLPNIDETIPPMKREGAIEDVVNLNNSVKTSAIIANPQNQMWIQGPPPIFINNEAPAPSRALDALACAIRSCCDQANYQFAGMAAQLANGGDSEGNGHSSQNDGEGQFQPPTSATSKAVMANQKELCSRNMVLSAATLVQQECASSKYNIFRGLNFIVSSMDVFLEGGDEEESGGFSDSQIQGIMKVCNTVIENPLLLFHAGPTYHMVSNASVLIAHLLNGLHSKQVKSQEGLSELEKGVFNEFLDLYVSLRKLLKNHRKKLPVRLRCHSLPRANFMASDEEEMVDLGQTFMCGCRGCQGFVLMGCSPCVAAERAQASALKKELNAEEGDEEEDNFETRELEALGAEFDLDDDSLLNVLSRIITS